MASRRDKPTVEPIVEELKTVEDILHDSTTKLDRERVKILTINRKEQEKALADYSLALETKGIKATEKEKRQFLADYEKIKKANALKAIKEQYEAEKKNLINYYKENSKQAENEEKKKDKRLEKELEIAKLLSKVGEDGEAKSSEQLKKDTQQADTKQNLLMLSDSFKDVGKGLVKSLANLGDKLSGEINAVISSYSQYQSAINTRLQGTSATFQSVEKKLTSTLGMSPYVKTSSMLESLNELVAQGIAFNLEQRAFLDTLGEKIATTFDVANSSLLRIVKLQQADSTASRLGMEAYLTRYFNEMFQDTQYLSSTFDNVTAALLEATSQMQTKQSVEFEYVVQKWLGSLTAVGTSESTVQSLAEALGYLGSGNVSALSGTAMQNLLVMAASRAGLDYSSILTKGLNAYNTNSLLQAVVGYMQEIGQGSNQVVRSQYAKTFGVTVSDLTAVANLDVKDLDLITKNMMSYSGTLDELGYQLDEIQSRVSLAEQIQNMMTNIKFGIGQGIAQSPVMAGMWSITDLIQGVTGGIAIPAISVMGNSVDLNTTVENLIKTGLVGVSALGKIGDLFTGLGNAGNMSGLVQAYGLDKLQTTSRGKGLGSRSSGMSTSLRTLVGTFDGGEISEQALSKAQAEPEAIAKQKKADSIEKSTTDIYKYLLDMFDPKMNSLLTMMGSLSGFNVGISAWDSGKEKRDYVFNYGTSVTVSEAADTQATKNAENLSKITQKVGDIYNLLYNGISVKVTSMPASWPLLG